MKHIPKNDRPVKAREQITDASHTINRRDIQINIFPRITEWLDRKNLLAKYAPYTPANNQISWIKKQNRYCIHKGMFTEEMLNEIEQLVKDVDYENMHFVNYGIIVLTLPNE